MKQSDKSKEFIKGVETLLNTGQVKNKITIVQALGWDNTMMSNVLAGRRNVPNDIYLKFTEIYKPVNVNDSPGLGYENLIAVDAKCDIILSTLAELLAHQRGQPVAKISGDLVLMVNQSIKSRLDKL